MGSYATKNRTFDLTLNSDYSLAGNASVDVPTTIMGIFGQKVVKIAVHCTAQIGMSNSDVTMVLDVTGSMLETNPGDPKPKIELLKDTVTLFYYQLTTSAPVGTRMRFGFVPYSTNVNTGALLDDKWVVKKWDYQSRKEVASGTTVGTVSYWTVGNPISGTARRTTESTYAANENNGAYSCNAAPANNYTSPGQQNGTTTEPFAGPPTGTLTRVNYTYTYNGIEYAVSLAGQVCTLTKIEYADFKVSYDWVTQPTYTAGSSWLYDKLPSDVSNWRSETTGCMEEPDTYDVSRQDLLSDNVDLKRARDLDVDNVPTGNKTDQWRPMYPGKVYGRAMTWQGYGQFTADPVTTANDYVTPQYLGTASCPSPAQKLKEMTSGEVAIYLAGLKAGGSTYHDTGLLWGARLISPTGLFASENTDAGPGQPTRRNIVMLTDGQTSTLDLSYSAYGFEPVDQRRWKPGNPDSLTALVEARFAFICAEAKKRNIAIWFVAFGTELNPTMETCAGPGHAFQADNGTELEAVFTQISNQISDLRLTE